jgi:hypothetical protein
MIKQMPYWLPLLLSALSTNGVHGYLLFSQRTRRKFTISEHAVLHRKSLAVYRLGHLVGGASFLVFAKLYYVNTVELEWLFGLSIFAVLFEYIQALVPAQGRTIKLHTRTALVMWTSFITIGLSSIVFVPTSTLQRIAAVLIYTVLLASLFRAGRNWEKMYKYQMVMVLALYASIFVLVV